MVCEKFNDVKIAGLISAGSSDGLKMAIDIYGGAVKTICGSFLKGIFRRRCGRNHFRYLRSIGKASDIINNEISKIKERINLIEK